MTRTEPPRPHLPMRPLWRCRACGAEWPCSPARLRLLREYDGYRLSLAFYLVVMLNEAVQDAQRLGLSIDLAAWYTRMVAWIRRPEVPVENAPGVTTPVTSATCGPSS
ncbi:hypothetical protein [Micromonospora olivasterospora]|uniref:hypothetical protein n=1 Tax=Micromonospora olivasterospora TaxID=1880 RepID=UPI001B864027|nr:hypothetical protein [Micromonospora olivasterospora]